MSSSLHQEGTKAPQRKRLPIKRRKFVEALTGVAEGNQTKAARIAKYAHPRAAGSKLLTFAAVQEAIEARLANSDIPSPEEIQVRLQLMSEGQIPTKTRVESGLAVGADGSPMPVDKTIDEYDRLSPTNSLAKIRGLLKDAPAPPPPTNINLRVVLSEMGEDAVEALVEAMARSKAKAIDVESKPA